MSLSDLNTYCDTSCIINSPECVPPCTCLGKIINLEEDTLVYTNPLFNSRLMRFKERRKAKIISNYEYGYWLCVELGSGLKGWIDSRVCEIN